MLLRQLHMSAADAREGYLASYPPIENRSSFCPTLAFAIVEGHRDILSRNRCLIRRRGEEGIAPDFVYILPTQRVIGGPE
jgi:hypothetical protein